MKYLTALLFILALCQPVRAQEPEPEYWATIYMPNCVHQAEYSIDPAR